MRILYRLKWIGVMLGILLGAVLFLTWLLWLYFHPRFEHEGPTAYAQRRGKDLTVERLRPPSAHGVGVVVLISGSWRSRRDSMQEVIVAPLLRRGYTVFMVTHGSQPEFTVMEIVEDVTRAVRFIRHRAQHYRIDASRLGVVGGSSGGHLSLMLATRGRPGNPNASDPIERESSEVQAAACFYPVTDLLNLGTSTENPGDGGPPKSFVRAFGPQSTNRVVWKQIGRDLSPIYHVSSNTPPILILHGSADTLVPLDQSERFVAEMTQQGRPIQLVVRPGKKHGWPLMIFDVRLFARWFDQWLRPTP